MPLIQEYVFSQPFNDGQDMTQGQFLSGLNWDFLSPTLCTLPRLKSPVCSAIYQYLGKE